MKYTVYGKNAGSGVSGRVVRKEDMMRKMGFTLVETAMTVALASVVALSVYASISYGLRVWQRVQAGMAEEDVAIFFSKINDEFDNTIKYPGLEFHGNHTEVAFPTIIPNSLHYPQEGRGPGLARYIFDESSARLQREYLSLNDIFEGHQLQPALVLDNISTLSFLYYYFDEEKQEYTWSDEWPPEEVVSNDGLLPLAVRIVLNFQKKDRKYEYNQTFSLPLSQ